MLLVVVPPELRTSVVSLQIHRSEAARCPQFSEEEQPVLGHPAEAPRRQLGERRRPGEPQGVRLRMGLQLEREVLLVLPEQGLEAELMSRNKG